MIYTTNNDDTPIFIAGSASDLINDRLDALEAGGIGSNAEKIFVTVGKNDSTADYNTADYANDMLAISNAITYAVDNNFTKILIKKGNYIYNSNSSSIQLVSNFIISGEEGTKITGSKNADWIFRNNSTNGNSIIDNCIIKDINFDLQNVENGSAIAFLDSRNSGTINCNYVNGGAGGWFIKFGTEPSTTSTFFGDNNFVLDSNWNNHAGSLEMLLIYNQKNFYGENWVYENKTGSNPVFGLWQNTENTRIKNFTVRNCNGFSYYSNSTNNTFIDNFYVENSGCALQGANVSDNLIFGPIGGIQRAVGLYVNNFVAKGGANSSNSSAIELGAIQDYNIDAKFIEGYQRGFTFSKGNNSNNANAKYGIIKVGTIKNLNPGNLNYDLSAPFVFVKGGDYHLRVVGGNIYDERTTPLMIQPIFYEWDGDSNPFSNITFEGGDFRSYLDRPTFRKNSNVTLESSVRMESMKNPVKGSFSSYYYDYAEGSNTEKNFVTVGLNDSTVDINTADYASINLAFQEAYNTIIAKKGGEIHILGGKNDYINYSLDSNNLNFNNAYPIKWKGIGKVQLRSKDGSGVAVLIRQEGSIASQAQAMTFENLRITNVDRNALGTVADQETYAIVSNYADELNIINIETEMFEKAIRIRACKKVRAYNCEDWSGDTNSRGTKNHFTLNNVDNFRCVMCRGSINDTAIRMAGIRNVYIKDFDYSIGSIETSNFENGGHSEKIWIKDGYLRKNNGNALGILIKGDGEDNTDNTILVNSVKVGVHDYNVHNVHIELDDIANKSPHAIYASGEGTTAVGFPDIHIGYIDIRNCTVTAPDIRTTNVKTFGFTFSNSTFSRKILKVISKNNNFYNLTEYGENYYNVLDLDSDNNTIYNCNSNGSGSIPENSGIAIHGDISNITTRAKLSNLTIDMNNNANSNGIYINENYIDNNALSMNNNHLFNFDKINGEDIKYELNIRKGYQIQENAEVENLYATLSTNTNISRDDAKNHFYTISDNIDITLLEPTEKRAGDVLHLTLIQDLTGFRTVNLKNDYQGTITNIVFDELAIQPTKETKIELIYQNNTWTITDIISGALTNFNDFNFGFGDLITGSTPTGGFSTITNSSAPYQEYNGSLFLATGTTNNGTASRRSELITVLRDNKTIFESIFRFPQVNDGVDNFYSIIGFTNSLSNPSRGVYISYSTVSNNFELISKSTTGTTTTDTNVVVQANTDYKVRLVIDSLNSICKCYINDVLVATNTSNIPNASTGAENRVNLQITKLLGTTTRYVIFDYILLKLMKIN